MKAGDRLRIDSLGEVGIIGEIHRGAMFDVLHVVNRGGDFAVKIVAEPSSRPPEALFEACSEVNPSVHFTYVGPAIRSDEPPRALLEELLVLEGQTIIKSAGAWNHSVECIGTFEVLPGSASPDARRSGGALVMPLHRGTPASELPSGELRKVLPRLLPSMYTALAAARHGDLRLDNILIDLPKERFVLIDPGVGKFDSWHQHAEGTRPDFDIQQRHFISNVEAYPLLPPTWAAPLGPARDVRTQVREASERFGIMLWAVLGLDHGKGLDSAPQQPSPPDWFALGVLYYQVLTGRHPVYDHPAFGKRRPRMPFWCGGGGGRMGPGSDGSAHALRLLDAGWVAPRMWEPSVNAEEQALALALLELRLDTRRSVEDLVASLLRR